MLLSSAKLTKHQVIFFVFLVCALALLCRSHGYSIHTWRPTLEVVGKGMLYLGPPRGIRGDDWMVNFTYWKVQELNKPKNPVVNSLIGYGQDLSLSPFVFVRHWSSFFKPHLWGFWKNVDFGMSWLWQFLSVGLFFTVFFGLLRFAPSVVSPFIGLLFALAFLFSNFIQLWSLGPALSFIYGGIGFLAFCNVLTTRGLKLIINCILLVWSLAALGFVFYPPFQIPVIHLLLIGMGLFTSVKLKTTGRLQLFTRLSLVFICGLMALAIFIGFLYEKQDVVRLLLSTEYPGKRVSVGGGVGFIRLVQDSIFPFLGISNFSKLGGNICEAGGFLNFLPLIVGLNLFCWKKLKRTSQLIFIFFGAYLILICFWWKWGVPVWLAKATGLSLGNSVRAVGIIGITHLIFLTLWFDSYRETELLNAKQRGWWMKIWYFFMAALGIYVLFVSSDFSDFPIWQKLGCIVLMVIVSMLGKKIIEGNVYSFAKGFAGLTILLTFFFNPIVFGGGESLLEASTLIQQIQRVEEQNGKGMWVAFDNLIAGHAPSLSGAASFSGVYLYPDMKLWKILDPEGKQSSVWNRYAHVVFELDPQAKSPRIITPQGDVVKVVTALDSEIFLNLPVRYVMVPIIKESQIPNQLFQEVSRTGEWILAKRIEKN